MAILFIGALLIFSSLFFLKKVHAALHIGRAMPIILVEKYWASHRDRFTMSGKGNFYDIWYAWVCHSSL